MADIDNVRLPSDIESGAEIGPSFQTSVIELTSGHEQRNIDWSTERLRANISYGMMKDRNANPNNDGEIDRTFREILDFYRARFGMARGFLFKDWSDYSAENVVIGEGDGINKVFQLKLIYEQYQRRITRPVPATVKCYIDGVERSHTLTDGGTVTLSGAAPDDGAEITADFEFDIPVRFNSDVMQATMAWARAGEILDIELIGLRDETD